VATGPRLFLHRFYYLAASLRLRLSSTGVLLDFRDTYHARSRLLDYLDSDGFDYWSDRLFPHDFLHWRSLGLGLGNRLRLRSLAYLTAFS
jgi:hypothetical protein